MIKSPCKNCKNQYLTKDKCSKTCEKLKNMQMFQHSKPDGPYRAVDSSDSGRYRLSLPVSKTADI